MPTTRHRINLTPSDELKAALEGLARAAEKPVSTVVTDLLTEMIPQLQDLAKVLSAAKAGKKAAAKRALQHMVGNALAEQLELMNGAKK